MIEASEYSGTDNVLLADVTVFALNTMLEHGLIENGWFFSFDRAKKRLGACHHDRKMITMSRHLTVGQTYEQIKNTVLHEIAHALVGPKHGHDAVWKTKAIEIGCDGERCGQANEGVAYRWVGRCWDCDYSVGFHRAPGRVHLCPRCTKNHGGNGFDFILEWSEFGQSAEIGDMPEKFRNEYYDILRRLGHRTPILDEIDFDNEKIENYV
jgi:hypothetical protein